MTITRSILDDAIRRTLPATLSDLCDATGASEPTVHRALGRLRALGCVQRTGTRPGAADVWQTAPGATWAHLRSMGVHVG